MSGFGKRVLKAILKARKRASASYVSPIHVNLEKVKLSEPKPFVSIHVAVYNEPRVVERLIRATTSQDWFVAPPINADVGANQRRADERGNPRQSANYEVVIVDDSTDETTEMAKQLLASTDYGLQTENRSTDYSLQSTAVDSRQNAVDQQTDSSPSTVDREGKIFIFTKPNAPTVKLIHRSSRAGFKGGALHEALRVCDPKAEYIVVFDADFVPYSDTIEQFVKTFQVLNANSDANVNNANGSESKQTERDIRINSQNSNSHVDSHSNIAAVQGYQWHVLNKSANWITRGVRTEYAGSYVIERSTEEVYGGLKQIAGSVYCIRADVLRKFGWGTSITEDFELTLRLYEAGYKVVFTPYIQVPAEAVSTIKRLIRQRMRWAEGSSFNIKVMFGRMVFGRWETQTTDYGLRTTAKSDLATAVDSSQKAVDKIWVPSPLSRQEKLEFIYFAFYYLQAVFFVFGTFAWFISETVFNARLPFWTAALGWSLVFTNLLALPLMNLVGMFLEESEERDYLGVFSFVALSYIVVPFQAYAAIKGFLEREEGPWFRTPKTGLITDVFGRSGFGKFFGGLLRHPAGVNANVMRMEILRMDANMSNSPHGSAFNLFGGRFVSLPVGNPIRPGRRFKFVSRGVIAIILVFSMIMNYLAFVGDVLNQPERSQTEAQESGPTKIGESNLAASRPEPFVPQIEVIEVDESTKISSDVDFLYQAYLDDDNLALFGRLYANNNANENTANVSESISINSQNSNSLTDLHATGVVRIVYAGGKYMQYDLPGIIGGPTAGQSSVSFETEESLLTFGINASRLKQELTIYSSSSNNNLEMNLTMSEGLTVRRQTEEGWQIIDESAKTTVFFIKTPTVKDVNGASHANMMQMQILNANNDANGNSANVSEYSHELAYQNSPTNSHQYQVQLSLDLNFLEGVGYPITIGSGIQTNPPYPVFNIADARENNTSDYNYVVTVPGNRNKVGFNKKGANTVGYRIDTGDNLYNMEISMRERAAAPASVEGGKITYDLGNMEAVYEVWTDRVKADYILKSKPAKNTIDFNLNQFSMIAVYNCVSSSSESGEGGRVEKFSTLRQAQGSNNNSCEKDGSISFYGDDGYGNINNQEVFRLEIPEIRDGNGNQVPKDKASLSITNDNECGTNLNESLGRLGTSCTGLVPEKLVPKYCVAENKDCKEPPGYYDRSGIVTLTIDQNFLDTATYPITVDPTTLDSSADDTATAYGSQRHVVRMGNGTLVVGYQGEGTFTDTGVFSISFDDGTSWYNAGGDQTSSLTTDLAIATLNNEIHTTWEDVSGTDNIYFEPFGGDIAFKTSSNTVEDQIQTNIGGTTVTLDGSGAGATDVLAQSFDPTVTNIDEVEIYVGAKNGTGSDLNVQVRESKNNSREPDMATAALATCSIAAAAVTAGAFNSCTFADTTIDAAKNYFIIVYSSNADATNNITIETRQPAGTDYSGGYNLFATNWTAGNNTPTWGFNGAFTLDGQVSLDLGEGNVKRPSLVIDKNNFPAVSWSYETSGGTKNSAVRFSRAVADPTTSTNWECATAASCAYVKTTDCNTDVCGDHIQPVTGVNSTSHSVLVKAPSTATNADELVIFMLWNSDTDLDAYAATVNGANYNAWSRLCTTDCETDVVTSANYLSALSVDDGTNQRIWVAWRNSVDSVVHLSFLNADDNTWTSSPTGTPKFGTNTCNPSLAYNATNNDVYVWVEKCSVADTQIMFRKYDITNSSWDSSDQLFDLPPSADDLIYPNLKEDNAPTTSPGPKLDLVYMEVDTAPNPDTYTVFYHTWHTKETRNYDNPAAISTTSEALTITSGDNNLSFFYDENEYDDTNSDNDVFVPASTSSTSADVAHTFKKTNSNATDEIQITWRGKKVTEACGSGVAACTLEIFEWGKTGCTAGWDTLGTADTSTAAGTEFALTGTTTNTCYYSGTGDQDDHLGANTAAVRVQTDCTTNCNLQTDVITFVFVPERVLWLLPLALFLPRIMRRLGLNVRFKWRVVYANTMRM